MKRALLIASAVAAVVAGQALAESGNDQPIDEKCYGVSPHNVLGVRQRSANLCAYGEC